MLLVSQMSDLYFWHWREARWSFEDVVLAATCKRGHDKAEYEVRRKGTVECRRCRADQVAESKARRAAA